MIKKYQFLFNLQLITDKKDYEISEYFDLKGSHKGEIRCIIYKKIFNSYYVITGSVDRKIKIW